jgi:Mrp family chromosome partitioning ATPase
MMPSIDEVRNVLRKVFDPELKRDLVDLGMVRHIGIEEGEVMVTLALTTLACPLKEKMAEEARSAILGLDGAHSVVVELTEMTAEEKQRLRSGGTPAGAAAGLNQVGRVISVMSGKGGVGKSLVSGLTAIGLRRAGHSVGLLDADITGPSIPKMFFRERPPIETSPTAFIPPQTSTGVRVMSINLLLESERQAVIWRGPLIGRAIQQFWNDVLWGSLDYLIVDLPPGTSDAPLTVLQSLPQSGVVLVTSPQDLAGMVVRKAAQMAIDLGVPVLGLIENMSYFVCPDCAARQEIFGPSHAEDTARDLGVPLLGRLPIDPGIAVLCDQGRVEEYADEAFRPIVERIAAAAQLARPPLFPATAGPAKGEAPSAEAASQRGKA